MRSFVCGVVVAVFALWFPLKGRAQSRQHTTIDTYFRDMEKALMPLGLVDASNCHKVRVYSPSTLGIIALMVGQDEKGEPRFNIYAADAIQSDFDLAALDEDRVADFSVVSGAELANHHAGDPWTHDKTAVLIPSSSPREQITVHSVDVLELEKQRAAGNQVSESNLKAMDTKVEERMAVSLLFSEKDSADAFVNALKKAIVVCKAQ